MNQRVLNKSSKEHNNKADFTPLIVMLLVEIPKSNVPKNYLKNATKNKSVF